MVNIEMDKRYIELNHSVNKINDWYEKDECRLLNIITVPYNTSRIFRELVKNILSNNKKILYVTQDGDVNEDIVKYLKLSFGFKSYSIIRNGSYHSNTYLHFISYENIRFIEEDYELIIYDDITSFSRQGKLEIQNSVDFLYKRSNKVIVYSTEAVFINCPYIQLGNCFRMTPFVEPRIITTRIDLNKDIPYLLYDYLKWFKDNNRKVLIHTPSKEKTEIVYNYYNNILKVSSRMKLVKVTDSSEIKTIEKLHEVKDKPVMVITNLIVQQFEELDNIDVIIYFADDKFFDYKKIVYLCGKVGKVRGAQGEVILLANEVSAQMEYAKDLAREFNKAAWEKGLLK
ncbi:hypothetical protein CSC2_17630 [Clostridium zeae]|uniref:Comf operon protein A, DNA transporter ATPase n=1 Tax=Clostridium zeae TaxID=2759022 RepID=A0ABQ1E8W6_9CLOT|nr:hypothetical protein [Clostridium zeae]GFZ31237.1 hypothetical protein CSC2_17630 [Clostridium zeae]